LIELVNHSSLQTNEWTIMLTMSSTNE